MIRPTWARSALAAAALALAAQTAGATDIPNAAYTLDAPVAWNIIGASGTVDPYAGPDLDSGDVICLDGSCGDPNDFSNQDWMVFSVSVTSGSLDQVTVGALFAASIGVGFFDLAGQDPTSGDATTNPNSPEYFFSSLTGTSALLVAMFDAGDLPSLGGGPFLPGSTNFDLRLGGASDQFVGVVTTPINVVPEPTTAALLGLGLAGLALRRRAL